MVKSKTEGTLTRMFISTLIQQKHDILNQCPEVECPPVKQVKVSRPVMATM